jgi:hypothetical protein
VAPFPNYPVLKLGDYPGLLRGNISDKQLKKKGFLLSPQVLKNLCVTRRWLRGD